MTLAVLPKTAYQTVNLVALTLPAGDHATIVPFDPRSHRATALSRADGDATWADADCIVIPPTVPIVAVIVTVVAVPPDLNIDALCLDRSGDRGSRQHCYGCRHDESDLHHWGILLMLDTGKQRGRTRKVPFPFPVLRLEFPESEALAISIPRTEAAVIRHLQAKMPYGLVVPVM